MEPPPPSYEEVVEGKIEPLVVVSAFQREKEKLELEKKKAVESEDYERAKQLKEQIDNLVKNNSQISILEEKKREAIAEENYSLAMTLKKEIDALKAGVPRSEVVCYDLGHGSGFLVQVKAPRGGSCVRPTPVIVLDRSLSMKGSCRWAITVAVPTALSELGYADTDRCILLTFDSVVERVKIGQHDPSLRDLWTIDVSARGKTTMLSQVFGELRKVIQAGNAYNVFVISDGFVHDMQDVRPAVRDVTLQGVTNGSRVSFALFRFFNGTPPDTVALAAVASIGNDGCSPCVDCIPPMEWMCTQGHLTTFRKTRCDSCSAMLNVNNVGHNGREPLTQFCLTAKEAFFLSLNPHCRVRPINSNNCHAVLMRVPFVVNPSSQSPAFLSSMELGLDVPCDREVIIALSEIVRELSVGGTNQSVQIYQGLPPENKLADFCTEALAQLRLWAVGGVRKKQFSEAIEWFRRFARLRASGGKTEGKHVIARAWSVRHRLEEGESALGRICSLGDADSFVSSLNSKQQGDFLRGASVARAERALTRRTFGSDIVFHDAARTALAALPSIDKDESTNAQDHDEKEETYISSYGGGTYNDNLHAAGVLSKFTEDLSVPDILEVVGGLGVPFCSNASKSKSVVDLIWEWEMSAVDGSVYLSEADVWAAKATGEPLKIGDETVCGVIPLAQCSSSAHATYHKMLGPLALMHVGSQLHGNPAREVWSWDRAPYSLEEASAAREAAALRCLMSKAVGTSKVPSAAEANVIFALLSQFRERAALLQDATIQQIPFAWARGNPTPPNTTCLLAFAVSLWSSLANDNHLEPKWARRLHCLEVSEVASRSGVATAVPTPQQAAMRNEALLKLLAADPDRQRQEPTEDQIINAVQRRVEGQSGGNVAVDAPGEVKLADASIIIQRLPVVVPLLPLPLLVFGLYRVLAARKAGTELNPAAQCLRLLPSHDADFIWYGAKQQQSSYDLYPAYVIADVLCTSRTHLKQPDMVESLADVLKELHKILEISIRNDYLQRLNTAVTARLQAKRMALEKTLEHKSFVSIDLPHLEAICASVKGNQVSPNESNRPHISFVLCGSCDCGKSTLAGRLLLETGRLTVPQLRKLHSEAANLGKESYTLAFAMDKLNGERERGISIILKKDWIPTTKHIATLLDGPGHRDFVGNLLRGVAQGDVGILIVPAGDSLAMAVARGNVQLGEKQGAVRTHARFLAVSGIKQLIVLINKMDSKSAAWSEQAYNAARDEVKMCLRATGWKSEHLIPMIPISGVYGDNVVYPSAKMPWWKGQEVPLANGTTGRVMTLMDALNDYASPPPREIKKPLRMPISNVFKIKGVGDVLTGRIERGSLKPGAKVSILGRGKSITCAVHTIETHHTVLREANAGHIVGVNVKGLVRELLPEVGDVLVAEDEKSLSVVKQFTAQVLIEHHGQVAVGYTPLCAVRTAKYCARVSNIVWKKSASGDKVDAPPFLTRGDFAEVVFDAMGPLVLDTFSNCEALSRVIFLDGGECVMIGKVTHVVALPSVPLSHR